jgi:hypothetical protein
MHAAMLQCHVFSSTNYYEEQVATAGRTRDSLGHQSRASATKEHAANTPQVRGSTRGEAGSQAGNQSLNPTEHAADTPQVRGFKRGEAPSKPYLNPTYTKLIQILKNQHFSAFK